MRVRRCQLRRSSYRTGLHNAGRWTPNHLRTTCTPPSSVSRIGSNTTFPVCRGHLSARRRRPPSNDAPPTGSRRLRDPCASSTRTLPRVLSGVGVTSYPLSCRLVVANTPYILSAYHLPHPPGFVGSHRAIIPPV